MRKIITNFSRKNNRFIFLLFCLFQILFLNQNNAQTISVSGKITSSRIPIKYATVTFIDNADTTIKFSTLTTTDGTYQINLSVTSVEPGNNLPTKFELEQNYPNPFSSSTAIPYQIKKESDVEVTIYNILGRVVKKFNVGQQSVGLYNVLWDGRNNFGQKVASGVYFYKLSTDNESQVKKMIFSQNVNGFTTFPHFNYLTKNSSSTEVNKTHDFQGNTFTIRLENTSTTLPAIVPQELQNVVIQKDTTISFSVDYLPTASIDFDSLHQIIRGFGAANIVGWRPDMTDSEIQTAFGTGDGQLGFTILRLRIQPDSTQWNTNVTTALKAYNMGAKIIASPWTPPAFMKTNNDLVGGELIDSSYADYASHLKAFADYMAAHGVPLYAVSLQNEPDANVTYESCDWNGTQFLNFCKNYAQSIGYRIMMPESQNFVKALSDPTLNDSIAEAHVSIIGGHIYGGGLAKYPLAESKGKEVWMTEHLTESSHSANVWSLALDVANEMQGVLLADMNAYVWWYIVRYYGPIGDGESSTTFPNEQFSAKGEVTKKGFVMSQFARFIRPGFYRVESSVYPSVSSNAKVTAYKDPSSSKIVIVAINTGTTEAEVVFRIQNGATMTTFTPYTTSETKNCEKGDDFDVTGDNFTLTLEPESITTFVSN